MSQQIVRLGSSLALFSSGFAALIYQSTWAQYLGLILGHSAYAQSLVLMLFMGGMAGGAALGAKIIASIRRPILWYVGVELFLAAAGLSYHYLFTTGRSWILESVLPWMDSAWAAASVSWTFGALTILLQTIALGATFPLIAEVVFTQTHGARGRIVSTLYFANSIGAGFAALANVAFFLPAFGLPGAVMTAGLLNALAAGIIWITFGGYDRIRQVSDNPEEKQHESVAPKRVTRQIYWAAAITGAASFVYEIVWVRILANALGASMHVFELMLSAFILGIALGGYIIRKRIDQIHDLTRAAGFVQIGMGLFAVASCLGFAGLFHSVPHFMDLLANTDPGYWWFSVLTSLIGFLVMLPATVCAGMVLPLLTTSLLTQGGGDKSVGNTYAANTFGSIIGVMLAVHLLMPELGVEGAIWIAAGADLLLGLYLIGLFSRVRCPSKFQVLAASSSIVVFLSLAFVPSLTQKVLSSGVYRTGEIVQDENLEIEFYKDGSTASIAGMRLEGTERKLIKTNGKPDASITPFDKDPTADEPTMILAGAIPFSFRSSIKDVAVIGFGSGLTSHTVLGSQSIQGVDTIEIEPAMVEGAKVFGDRVDRVYEDPRSNIIIDDARAYFASTQKKYDVIISEPSNPWVSGVANLFTSEFYRFTKDHISDDGLLVQWIQLYEINPELVATIMNALSEQFSDYSIYAANETDLLILASPSGETGKPSKSVLGKDSGFSLELNRVGVRSLDDIEARFVGDKKMLDPFFEALSGRTNSDFFPIVGLEAPKARYKRESARGIVTMTRSGLPVKHGLSAKENRVSEEGELSDSVNWQAPRKRQRAGELFQALLGNNPGGQFSFGWAARFQVLEECPQLKKNEDHYYTALNDVVQFIKSGLNSDYGERLVNRTSLFECEFQDPVIAKRLELLRAYTLEDWGKVLTLAEEFSEVRDIGILSKRLLEGVMYASIILDEPRKGMHIRRLYGEANDLESQYSLRDVLLQAHLRDGMREASEASL